MIARESILLRSLVVHTVITWPEALECITGYYENSVAVDAVTAPPGAGLSGL